jgi:hypothetical protein
MKQFVYVFAINTKLGFIYTTSDYKTCWSMSVNHSSGEIHNRFPELPNVINAEEAVKVLKELENTLIIQQGEEMSDFNW